MSERVIGRNRQSTSPQPETLHLQPDGGIPNSQLPVLIYHDLEATRDAAGAEAAFAEHGWRGAWRDGIFSFHHFHSTAHEVLAIVAGSVNVRLGGPAGRSLEVRRGDVLVLPAGTGHRNEGDSVTCSSSAPIPTAWAGTCATATRTNTTRSSPTSPPCRFPTQTPWGAP